MSKRNHIHHIIDKGESKTCFLLLLLCLFWIFLMKKKCKNAKAQIKWIAGGHLYSSSYVAEKLWNTSLEETGQLVFKFKQRASHWPSADPAFKTCLHLSGQSSQDTQTVKDNSTEGQTLWLIKHFCQNTIRWKKPCGLNCVMFTMLDYASKSDFPIELKSIFNSVLRQF